jgi:hypothetical protein
MMLIKDEEEELKTEEKVLKRGQHKKKMRNQAQTQFLTFNS